MGCKKPLPPTSVIRAQTTAILYSNSRISVTAKRRVILVHTIKCKERRGTAPLIPNTDSRRSLHEHTKQLAKPNV